MFKLPVPGDQEKLIEAYKTLAKDQQKVSLNFSTAVFMSSYSFYHANRRATLPLPVRTL